MPKYIERDIALQALANVAKYYSTLDDCTEQAVKQCMSTIQKIPAANVAPVVHGRWEKDDDGIPHCTHCGGQPGLDGSEDYDLSDFCPRCGARMEDAK